MTGTPRTAPGLLRREWAMVHPRLRASMYQRAYLRHVLTLHRTARQAVDVYATTGLGAETAPAAIDRIRSEAAFLHDHVRPMVLRLDGRWLPPPQARVVAHPDRNFPAELPRTGARRVRAVRRQLDAMPAAQLAALLPESDTARADVADADLPLPLPAMERLDELRGELGELVTCLERAGQIAEMVDGVHDAAVAGRGVEPRM